MRLGILAISTYLAAQPAAAQTALLRSADGDDYMAAEGENGGVLSSVQPKVRRVTDDLQVYTVKGIDKIYFNEGCSALHLILGEGRWWVNDRGFFTEFDGGRRIEFPAQSFPWDAINTCPG